MSNFVMAKLFLSDNQEKWDMSYDAYMRANYEQGDCPEKLPVFGALGDVIFSDTQALDLLLIGPSFVDYEFEMLEVLESKFSHINVTAVDPSGAALDFQEARALKRFQGKLQWISCKMTIQEYIRSGPSKSFHLITACCCIAYFGDLKIQLGGLLQLLKPTGQLFINVQTDQSSLFQLWDKFPEIHEGGPRRNYSATTVRDTLETLTGNFRAKSLLKFTKYFDFSNCQDKSSQEGRLQLDFLTQLQNAHDVLSPDFLDAVLKFLRKAKVLCDDGVYRFNVDYEALLIVKV